MLGVLSCSLCKDQGGGLANSTRSAGDDSDAAFMDDRVELVGHRHGV